MNDESLFNKPPAEWSDDELRVGLAQVAERTELLHNIAAAMAEERDRRAKLYREMQDAVNPFTVVKPAEILLSPAQRREDRRRARPS